MRRLAAELPELLERVAAWLDRYRVYGAAIVVPAVAAMFLLRVVFVSFPVVDLVGRQDPAAALGGGAVIAFMVAVQAVVMRRVFTGAQPSAALRALVTAEFAVALVAVFVLGPLWVAMPVFGLVDVLLCMGGRVLACVVTLGTGTYVIAVARLYSPPALIAALAEFALAVFVLYVLPRLVISLRDLHDARAELATLALARDRDRLARDLHDTLGQLLSIALLKLEIAERVAEQDPRHLQREFIEIRTVLRESMVEMQRVVVGLRQTSLHGEIASASSVLTAAGIAASVTVEDVAIDPATAEVLAWVVREGTTNVLRHSAASRCEIVLTSTGNRVVLRLANDGPRLSAPATSGGNGINGLQERLLEMDGELSTACGTDGFVLTATVPVGR